MTAEYLKILPALTREDANRLHQLIEDQVVADKDQLHEADSTYGDSWCKRQGPGAWMVTVRKYDRLENQLKNMNYDVFGMLMNDTSEDGPWDDIGDLTRYLLLIRCYVQLELEKRDAVAGPFGGTNSN